MLFIYHEMINVQDNKVNVVIFIAVILVCVWKKNSFFPTAQPVVNQFRLSDAINDLKRHCLRTIEWNYCDGFRRKFFFI